MKKLPILLVLIPYLILALWNGWMNPLFEAPDEHHHYYTAEVIATTNKLPSIDDPYPRQESAQPPLYYLIGSSLIRPFGIKAEQSRNDLWFNNHPYDGENNRNAFFHVENKTAEYHAPAHTLRILSTLFGAGALYFIYRTATLITDKRAALFATALVGFLPQFIFIHSSVTNDSLMTFIASAVLFQLLIIWQQDNRPTIRQLLILGISIGLACLTKNQGVILVGMAGLVLLRTCWQTGWSQLGRMALTVGIPIALLAFPLYLRNYSLHEDIFATKPFIQLSGHASPYTDLQGLWNQRALMATSFIGTFGWQNIPSPTSVHAIWGCAFGAGLLGFLGRIRHKKNVDWGKIGLLLLWLVLIFGAWISFAVQTPATQGRLLFPALPTIALIGAGWGSFPKWVGRLIPVILLGTAVYCIGYLIPQSYAGVQYTGRPSQIEPLQTWNGVSLYYASPYPQSLHAGDTLYLDTIWYADGDFSRDNYPQLDLFGFGRNYAPIAHADVTFGNGLSPLPSGEFSDRLALRIDEDAKVPTVLRPTIRLNNQAGEWGTEWVKLIPETWPAISPTVSAEFGQGIELVSADYNKTVLAGQTVPISLDWQTTDRLQTPVPSATVFLHLLNSDESGTITQADFQPLNGDYPTPYWEANERFNEVVMFEIPADAPTGSYKLIMGMYDASINRFPVQQNGVSQPNAVALLGTITVQ